MRFLFSLIFLLFSCFLSAQKINVIEIVQVPTSEFRKADIYYANNWKSVMDSAYKAGIIQQYDFEYSDSDSAGNLFLMMTTTFQDSIQYNRMYAFLNTLFRLKQTDVPVPVIPLETPANCRLIFRGAFNNAAPKAPEKKIVDNPGHLE